MKNSMTASLKDELSQLREINDLQKEISGFQKELISIYKQLVNKGDSISELELKLVKSNYKLQEATKKLELHMPRLALFAFEKATVGVRDPKFRGDDWETFFATSEYEGLLEEEGYNGCQIHHHVPLFLHEQQRS